MREPTRVHITWVDDNTLKVETDAGTQTRMFHFNAKMPAHEAASWQGYSDATWDGLRPAPRGGGAAPRRRLAQGGHHGPEARLPAQERRPV